jgi:hypothetical protein
METAGAWRRLRFYYHPVTGWETKIHRIDPRSVAELWFRFPANRKRIAVIQREGTIAL